MNAELGPATLDAPARRWKHYPAYKDSGVEWLGEVPEHWEICPLRRKLRNGNGGIKIGPFGSLLKLEFMEESGYKVYGQEHVISGDFKLGSKYIHDAKFQELLSCSINPGDLLVSMMGTSGRCQKVPNNIEPGIMDSHLLRLRVRADELDSSFIALLIDQAYYVIEQLKASGKGSIMHGLNSSLVKEIILGIPTLSEQRAITSFLDRQTAHLDALILKKERLIALLEEKRSALISSAVTKGLDPNVPMKVSGEEWLGKVPVHWNVKRLKYIAPVSNEKLNEKPDELLYLGLEQVESKTGRLLLDNPVENVESIVRVFEKGDVLFGKLRPYLSKVVYAGCPKSNFNKSKRIKISIKNRLYL